MVTQEIINAVAVWLGTFDKHRVVQQDAKNEIEAAIFRAEESGEAKREDAEAYIREQIERTFSN